MQRSPLGRPPLMHTPRRPTALWAPMTMFPNSLTFTTCPPSRRTVCTTIHIVLSSRQTVSRTPNSSILTHVALNIMDTYQDVPRDNPDLVMGWCGIAPPVAVASLRELSHQAYAPCAALSYDSPPCVASAVVVNSSRNSHSCNTYHPAERRLSAVIPRDAAGTIHEMGPCGPSLRIPTAFGGMGPEGETPNDTGHHHHEGWDRALCRTHDAVGTTLVIIRYNQQHERRFEYQ
jgi:hypothetical protein